MYEISGVLKLSVSWVIIGSSSSTFDLNLPHNEICPFNRILRQCWTTCVGNIQVEQKQERTRLWLLLGNLSVLHDLSSRQTQLKIPKESKIHLRICCVRVVFPGRGEEEMSQRLSCQIISQPLNAHERSFFDVQDDSCENISVLRPIYIWFFYHWRKSIPNLRSVDHFNCCILGLMYRKRHINPETLLMDMCDFPCLYSLLNLFFIIRDFN